MANHSDPESCGAHREVCVEALTGETGRPAIEPQNDQFGMPTLLSEAEGNTVHGVNRKPCPDPARSETLVHVGKSFIRKQRDLISVQCKWTGRGWEGR